MRGDSDNYFQWMGVGEIGHLGKCTVSPVAEGNSRDTEDVTIHLQKMVGKIAQMMKKMQVVKQYIK